MSSRDRSHALNHIVVVLFEHRSVDNVLGHLYGPDDGKSFEGVIGKDLSNPIPQLAENGAESKVVPYTVATNMDGPDAASAEEYSYTDTQLYNDLERAQSLLFGFEWGPAPHLMTIEPRILQFGLPA